MSVSVYIIRSARYLQPFQNFTIAAGLIDWKEGSGPQKSLMLCVDGSSTWCQP
jgi:hypothetical protein